MRRFIIILDFTSPGGTVSWVRNIQAPAKCVNHVGRGRPHIVERKINLRHCRGAWDACWSPPPFPKDGRLRLIDFPIEKFIIARPRVDLSPANLTAETARMLVWMLLPCRGVWEPAVGTAKIFGRPYVACHPAIMHAPSTCSSPAVCHNQ